MTVTSGRCVPPLNGLFSATTSPGFSVLPRSAQHRAHALAHRAQMHRHMRRVRHQAALGVEDRAGKIQPLLDVHANRRVLQHRAGLFRNVHEQVVEQLQQHRIGPARCPPRRAPAAARCGAASYDPAAVISAVQPGSTTVVALASRISAGPANAVAGPQRGAVEHRRVVRLRRPRTCRPDRSAPARRFRARPASPPAPDRPGRSLRPRPPRPPAAVPAWRSRSARDAPR